MNIYLFAGLYWSSPGGFGGKGQGKLRVFWISRGLGEGISGANFIPRACSDISTFDSSRSCSQVSWGGARIALERSMRLCIDSPHGGFVTNLRVWHLATFLCR